MNKRINIEKYKSYFNGFGNIIKITKEIQMDSKKEAKVFVGDGCKRYTEHGITIGPMPCGCDLIEEVPDSYFIYLEWDKAAIARKCCKLEKQIIELKGRK